MVTWMLTFPTHIYLELAKSISLLLEFSALASLLACFSSFSAPYMSTDLDTEILT